MAASEIYEGIQGMCSAASDGKLEVVKRLVQNGVDVNWNSHGSTPLYCATRYGHSEIIEFLISKGAKGYTYNIDGLASAALDGRLKDVKQHLQSGVDVNGVDWSGNTPLYWAAQHGHSEVIEVLISEGAKGYTDDDIPLNIALRHGQSQVVQLLVSKGAKYDIAGLCSAAANDQMEYIELHLRHGVSVNGQDRYGNTPLYWATQQGHSRAIAFLISRGAIGYTYNIEGLYSSARDGRIKDVKQHLQKGVDVNGENRDGDIPLNIALRLGKSQVVQLLVSEGAKYNIKGLCCSVRDGRLKDVKQYLQNGVNINQRDSNAMTPLQYATLHGHSEVIEFLISKGAKRDRYYIDGLFDAASNGRLEDVKQHLQNGLNVNGRDKNGKTPLFYAARNHHLKVLEFLISKGAERDIHKDLYGYETAEVKSAFSNYEKNKKNSKAALQKCITKAKNQKGKVKVKFIKLLFTGSGKAGKTSFHNLLMKNKFVNFHHSTSIVQAKHAVSVKKAFLKGSYQCDDQNVVWVEINDDSQMTHLRQILLSLDIPSQKLKDQKLTSPSALPPPHSSTFKSQAAGQSNDIQRPSIKKEYVTHQSNPKRGLFRGSVKSVKSKKLTSFNTLVESSIESNILEHDVDYHGEVLNIITLLDTGGQPEYIHLLPTVNISPMVNFVVHKLSKNLEDQVLVEYSEHGKPVFEPYHLKYSNFDMVKFLMSSINDSLERTSSQVPQLVTIRGKNNNSYLCCVGTHVDEVKEDTICDIGSQLTALVETLDCKAAVWKNERYGVLFPVDNTTAGDETKEDPTAKFIRNKINQLAKDKDTYELPITWMLLELEIRKVCSDSGKAYMSFNECWAIAHQTNLISDIEEVKNALIYHHLLGVLLYYPDVPGLCEYVITDHQWLFDKISNIVCFTFKDSTNMLATNSLKYNGILTNKLIQELDWNEELREDYFIDLLVEMKIIAPIKREDGNEEDYFIPYILPTYSNQQQQCDDIISQYGCLQGEPLLIQFISNLLPRGFFCCLAVQMLQQLPKHWGCLFTQKDTHHTYSNLITFRLHSAYSLSLMDKLSYLEVQIRHPKKNYYFQHPIHCKVQELLSYALEVVCEQLTFNRGRLQYGFHCQCGEYDYKHIALLTRLTSPFDYALCRHGSVNSTELGDEHTVWLTEVANQTADNISNQKHHNLSDKQSKEYELFSDYYSKLINTLPASDLSHYFVSDKIISLEDHERIIKTTVTFDAAKLLLDKVSQQLQDGNNMVLIKMLLIMDYHGTDAAKTMSIEIRKILSAFRSVNKSEKDLSTTKQLELASLKVEGNSPIAANTQEIIEGSSLPIPEAAPTVTETTIKPTIECYSAEYEVFIQYFSQIVCCISAKTLSPHFVSQNIISSEDYLEICNFTSHIKAAGLLLCKISYPIRAGITDLLYRFLDIVEQNDSLDSKTVTTAIRKKLKSKDKDDDISPAVVSPDAEGEDFETNTQ